MARVDSPLTSPSPERPTGSGGLGRVLEGIRHSLAGAPDEDFTRGSLPRAIALLAVPMVLEMSMESVFAVVDVFFVGRLGPDAVATVGLTEAVLTLVFAVAIGLSMATTAMVARRIGEKDREGAQITAVQAIGVGIVVSVLVGIAGGIGAPHILRWMGGSSEVVTGGSAYTAVLLGGSATVVLLFLINAIFRGAGDAVIAMRSLWLANLINIVLDPCLIFGLGPFPEMGLTGAAVATTIGRGTGVLYQLAVLGSGRGRITLRPDRLRLDLEVILRLLRVSVGGILQFLIATASWVALVRILSLFGSTALAGYTIALRILVFVILPAWGLSNAAATLVGQNLGAGRPERAEKSAWLTAVYNTIFLTGLGLLFLLFADPLVGVFTGDPAVRAVGARCLRIISLGYPFYAWGMVMVQAFNGAGDTQTPTRINFFCYWTFQIPLAYGLARGTGLEETGVFVAIAVAESVLALVGVLVFRRGGWKNRVV
jgi:putative MATE family efflux protein